MPPSDPQEIIDQIWAPDANGNLPRIFGLYDGARDKRIVPKLRTMPSYECQCLFTGRLSPRLQMAAPYLARLYPDKPVTRWLIEEGWGNAWGIFCSTDIDIDGLRLHFKKLLWVKDEDGRRMFFRFYDPRVMRVFLPTCDADQLSQIYDIISMFKFEGEAGEMIAAPKSRRARRSE